MATDDRTQSAATIPVPDYLTADDDSDWRYYVSGHDPDELYVIDEPDALEWQPLWMRPQRISTVDPEERGDGWESVTRDKAGRFQPAYCWIECRETTPGAVPFLGARYKA